MNIEYLYSIMNLYFRKETNELKTYMMVIKKEENVEFKFNMDSNDLNKTCFFLPLDLYEENQNNILNLYKDNQVIINEEYNNDNKGICKYAVKFKNNRRIIFEGFLVNEIKDIRNTIYSSSSSINKIDVKFLDNININKIQRNLTPAYSGYASFKSILLISLFFLAVLVISLIYFMK